MKTLLSIFCFLCISMSPRPEVTGNDYFHELTKELKPIVDYPAKISQLQQQELGKYKKSGDEQYLISSKYVELFLYRNNTNKQIPLVYELLKLNNNRYEYISMTSYYNVSIQLEKTSPELAMHFIDEAIIFNKTLTALHYSGHLYHMKGRLYYNSKSYTSALYYFNKALKSFRPEDYLYTASMHNNFGLTYAKLNNIGKALQETQKGIDILESKNNPTKEESDFLMDMKGSLGFYYYQLKDYTSAENLLTGEFEYCKNKKELFPQLIIASERLYDLYAVTGQKAEQRQIVDYLLHTEPLLTDTYHKIMVNEIVQKYYSANNDIQRLKEVSGKLVMLNHEFDDENSENIQKTSDLLNKNVIKSINERYDYEIKIHQKKQFLTLLMCCLIVITIALIALNIWTTKKSEKKDAEKQREILEAKKRVLEKDILFQNEKIKNLHQNLNLKIETEKAFLQNIKKIKKSADADSEQILRDLHLKVSKLIQIDKKNDDFVNESSNESKMFLGKLEVLYPVLTKRELKLCTYFRMNLSSKEISALEDTTTATIRVYKTRIKSKVGLGRQDNLVTFLNSI
ncbi:MAG: hypothetical protein L0G39_21510 [Chryseobacterium sp.]|nr:hypothetical protein [Chryseobacterium sp.]